jgi:hypothetical protein
MTNEKRDMTIANVPTVLEQRLFGTSISYENKLSKAELRTLFYVGRRLELIACYVPMAAPQSRIVKEHKSYGGSQVLYRHDERRQYDNNFLVRYAV